MKLDSLLKKVQSHESIRSPPPPSGELTHLLKRKKKHPVDKFGHVVCKVDTRAPLYLPPAPAARRGAPLARRLYRGNMALLRRIRENHFSRGRVDSSWSRYPVGSRQYHEARVNFSKRIYRENQRLYERFSTTKAKLTPTAKLERWWSAVKRQRLKEAKTRGPWLLAAPKPRLDPAFDAPPGFTRPRVTMSLRIRGAASLGTLQLELFADACPRTSAIFLALLPAYVGSVFHRKVPGLYWSGGSEACQRCAFPPENFHFPHSEPGLLTMQVSPDDEISGIFSILFKPLHQFDLRSVVFGRVILPSRTFAAIRELGTLLSSYPAVEITAASLVPRKRKHLPATPTEARAIKRFSHRTAPRPVVARCGV